MEGFVTISEKEYARLKARSNKLSKLEAGGVDNWEGYDTALEDNEDEDNSVDTSL